MSTTCARLGCGQTFDPAANDEANCHFHPGQPLFHEGRKSYSCCNTINKPVDSFDEWLRIPGCATGSHSADVERPKAVDTGAPVPSAAPKPLAAPAPTPAPAQPTISIPPRPPLPSAAKASTSTEPASAWDTKEIEQDAADAVPPPGATCKRSACGVASSNGAERTDTECCFHPGSAIFHEGSKGWSCCKPRVLEFDEFLKMPGCTRNRHLFVGGVKPDGVEDELVPCRVDHYQTATTVVVSLFGKGMDKQASKISFTHWEPLTINPPAELTCAQLKYDLRLPGGKRATATVPLFGPIDPDRTTFKIMSTKAECTLVKADGRSWPMLEYDEGTRGLANLTFGVNGRVGSVGSKTPIVAPDRVHTPSS